MEDSGRPGGPMPFNDEIKPSVVKSSGSSNCEDLLLSIYFSKGYINS